MTAGNLYPHSRSIVIKRSGGTKTYFSESYSFDCSLRNPGKNVGCSSRYLLTSKIVDVRNFTFGSCTPLPLTLCFYEICSRKSDPTERTVQRA